MNLSTLTTKQKWMAAGAIVLVVSAMNQSREDRPQPGYGPRYNTFGQTAPYANQQGWGNAPATQGWGGQPNGGGDDRSFGDGGEAPAQGGWNNGPAPMQGGGSAPVQTGDSGGDITSGYWDRQASQDRTNHAFDQYINDTTTIRDGEGTTYNDVSNNIASPAIESGSYSAVPTAELPTSYSAPAAETPASE